MGVALRGNLTDFGVAEVFQLIGQQRKTGFLDVTSGGESMRLAFDAGGVVWARPGTGTEDAVLADRLVRCGLLTQQQLEGIWRTSEASARSLSVVAVEAGLVTAEQVEQVEESITDETIFAVLRSLGGSFDFSARAVHHDRPPEKLLAAEQILMDGLRKVDEWQTFAALVPSMDTIFEPTGSAAGLRGASRGREQTYRLVDGRLTAQRIIDLSRLGLFDATRALAELHRDGLIAPLSARQARARSRRTEAPRRPVAEHVRWWLAAAFPLALLSLIVSMILGQSRAADGPQVFPIARVPVERARAVFETRRLRHALEAERMLSGHWPASLAEDAPELAALGALTPDDAGDYYYARRGNGIILLAPQQ